MTINVPFRCEMLVDQNRFISGDPIGRACPNDAAHQHPDGYLMCRSCLDLLLEEPDRITVPPRPRGVDGQTADIKAAHDRILNRMREPARNAVEDLK